MEYKACTEGVAVMDLTSLGLFEIEVQQADIVTKRRTFLCSVTSTGTILSPSSVARKV